MPSLDALVLLRQPFRHDAAGNARDQAKAAELRSLVPHRRISRL